MRSACPQRPRPAPWPRRRSRRVSACDGSSAPADAAGDLAAVPPFGDGDGATPPTTTLELSTAASLSDVSAAEWDACAGGTAWASPGAGSNPFVSHGFLRALETSGSVGRGTGWQPVYVLARDSAGALAGAVPSYLKADSSGEYVFDHAWAGAWGAYQRGLGKSYYPKLQACVPFSPVTGPRLLVRPSVSAAAMGDAAPAPPAAAVAAALVTGLEAVADALDLSSVHVTFPTPAEAALIGGRPQWLRRTGLQYHWHNRGYSSFSDFEAALLQRRRKAVRQERKKAREGLTIRRLRGGEITPQHWARFYDFYVNTVDRHWGSAYLTPSFFQEQLGPAVGDAALLVVAEVAEPGGGGRTVGAALNLAGSAALFGRNWGCEDEAAFPCLHFELCYYQAIEEAIACGLATVEAGAQGEHKVARGYLPTETHSAHLLRSPPFRALVANALEGERARVAATRAAMLAEASPYKRDADGGAPTSPADAADYDA